MMATAWPLASGSTAAEEPSTVARLSRERWFIKDQDMSVPTRVMHFATWLWSRPSVENLDLSGCQPLQEEVPKVVCAALSAGSLPKLSSVNVDGVFLPVVPHMEDRLYYA